MIIYAILEDKRRDEIGADSRFHAVEDLRISVLDNEALTAKKIIPYHIGSYTILNAIAYLGRHNWVCMPRFSYTSESYLCYRKVKDDSEYNSALDSIREIVVKWEG